MRYFFGANTLITVFILINSCIEEKKKRLQVPHRLTVRPGSPKSKLKSQGTSLFPFIEPKGGGCQSTSRYLQIYGRYFPRRRLFYLDTKSSDHSYQNLQKNPPN